MFTHTGLSHLSDDELINRAESEQMPLALELANRLEESAPFVALYDTESEKSGELETTLEERTEEAEAMAALLRDAERVMLGLATAHENDDGIEDAAIAVEEVRAEITTFLLRNPEYQK